MRACISAYACNPPRAGLADRRLAYRAGSLRWHPDKFTQSFGTLIVPAERDAVLKRVTEVSQAINAIFQAQPDK